MWSGIEDVYATKTKQVVPEAFLLCLSSFGETAFVKFGNKKPPFRFSVADGRTRKTYDQIKDILGLSYEISEGRTLPYALKSIYKEVDSGMPVILGPLDMFYLPYLKMYQKFHVPIHYVLMVGYDEEKECVLIYDCDRTDLIELPVEELVKAWQIEKNSVGDKNGFIRFRLEDQLLDKYELADICFKNKAARQLNNITSFTGVNAFERIAREFPTWEEEYSEADYKYALTSLAECFGTVPKIPNRLMGIQEKEDIVFQANYNRLSAVLIQLGKEYNRKDWLKAGELFLQCGYKIEEITNRIIRFCCDNERCLEDIPAIFQEMGEYSKKAYSIILNYGETTENKVI